MKQAIVFLSILAAVPAAAAQEIVIVQQEPAAPVERAWPASVAGAMAKAKARNKRVLVVFERDGCEASKQLAEACKKERELSRKILYEYELFRNDRFLTQFSVGTLPHDKIMRAIELYGTVVAPAVRKAVAK